MAERGLLSRHAARADLSHKGRGIEFVQREISAQLACHIPEALQKHSPPLFAAAPVQR